MVNKFMKLVTNKLRVLHFPNIPCKPFIIEVKDEIEAKKIIDVLAAQHLWLYENNFIPDYSNIIMVEMFDDSEKDMEEWENYWNEDELMEWDEFEQTYLL